MKYRKKPVVIEAIKFTDKNFNEIWSFVGEKSTAYGTEGERKFIHIHTLEGVMRAIEGDYIIKGIKGEFYPCKPDVFEETYEAVE